MAILGGASTLIGRDDYSDVPAGDSEKRDRSRIRSTSQFWSKEMPLNYAAFGRKFSLLTATGCLLVGITTNANALLVGNDVFGVLNFGANPTNLFDPANVGLPQGALNEISNPVTIAEPGLEFAHVVNGVTGVFGDFTDNSLTVSNDVVVAPVEPWTITFASPVFTGLILTEISDNFVDGGVTAALAGDTITLNWAGTSSTGLFQAVYSLEADTSEPPGGGSSEIPEPFTISLLGLGLVSVGVVAWRGRRRKTDV